MSENTRNDVCVCQLSEEGAVYVICDWIVGIGQNESKSKKIVLEVGLEPTTLGLLDPRSNQLSYTSQI
jgi:hypothetical protein